MSTIEIDAQKAELMREIISETDENVLSEMMLFFRSTKQKSGKAHLTLTALPCSDAIETHLASEYVLAKDWLNSKEDKAWKDL